MTSSIRPDRIKVALAVAGALVAGFIGLSASPAFAATAPIDTTPPVTTMCVWPEPNAAGWLNAMPILSFDATDGVAGSGVAATYASVDGVPVTSFPVYVTTQGVHQVRYLSQDAAGNIEPMRIALVCVDTSAPRVLMSAATTYTGTAQVSASATDRYSCVGSVEMRIDGGPWQSVTSLATSTPGPHSVDARAFDLAGNEGDSSSAFTILASTATTTQLSCAASVRVKRVLKLSGTVSCSAAPGAVDVTVSRRVGGTWRRVTTVHASFAQGQWSCSYRPTATGSWRFVATYLGGTTDTIAYTSSRSAVRTVKTTA